MKEGRTEVEGGMIEIEEITGIEEIIEIGEEILGGLIEEMGTPLGKEKEILIENLEEKVLQIEEKIEEMKGNTTEIVEGMIVGKRERILLEIIVMREEILP